MNSWLSEIAPYCFNILKVKQDCFFLLIKKSLLITDLYVLVLAACARHFLALYNVARQQSSSQLMLFHSAAGFKCVGEKMQQIRLCDLDVCPRERWWTTDANISENVLMTVSHLLVLEFNLELD